jgi:excisionase family DNA binding protein
MQKRKPRVSDYRASYSPSEVALRHGVGSSFVYDAIRRGELKASRLGEKGPLRVTPEAERAWLGGDAA